MTKQEYIDLTSRADALKSRLASLNAAIDELIGGAVSATISVGGSAQSYTRSSLSELYAEVNRTNAEYAAITDRLARAFGRSPRRRISIFGFRF